MTDKSLKFKGGFWDFLEFLEKKEKKVEARSKYLSKLKTFEMLLGNHSINYHYSLN